MSGYPHIETKQDYKRYQAAVERGMAGLTFFSTGTCEDCDECGEGDEEGHFSWSSCDICNRSLGGTRYPAHAWLAINDGDVLTHLDVCVDCYYYTEYGQLDDMTMLDMKEDEED